MKYIFPPCLTDRRSHNADAGGHDGEEGDNSEEHPVGTMEPELSLLREQGGDLRCGRSSTVLGQPPQLQEPSQDSGHRRERRRDSTKCL